MSREEQEKDRFTTPKKFAVITPSRSREKKDEKSKTTLASNSFYSLSKESFYTIPDHLSPEKMDKKVKKEEPSVEESRVCDFIKIHVRRHGFLKHMFSFVKAR